MRLNTSNKKFPIKKIVTKFVTKPNETKKNVTEQIVTKNQLKIFVRLQTELKLKF